MVRLAITTGAEGGAGKGELVRVFVVWNVRRRRNNSTIERSILELRVMVMRSGLCGWVSSGPGYLRRFVLLGESAREWEGISRGRRRLQARERQRGAQPRSTTRYVPAGNEHISIVVPTISTARSHEKLRGLRAQHKLRTNSSPRLSLARPQNKRPGYHTSKLRPTAGRILISFHDYRGSPICSTLELPAAPRDTMPTLHTISSPHSK